MEGMGFGMNKMGGKLCFCSVQSLAWAVCVCRGLCAGESAPVLQQFGDFGCWNCCSCVGGWAHPIK